MSFDQSGQGVYGTARKLPSSREASVAIPAFLSPGFFRFVLEFVSSPAANPVYLRELRRSRRAIRIPDGWLIWVAAAATFFCTLAGLVAIAFIPDSILFGSDFLSIAVFFGVQLLSSTYAFFVGFNGVREPSQMFLIRALALTPLHPQLIVFGFLAGAVAPIALPCAVLLPTMAFSVVDAIVKESLDHSLPAIGAFLFLLPNTLAAVLCSGAIGACTGFSYTHSGGLLGRALLTWWIINLTLLAPLQLMILATSGASVLLIGPPFMIALRLAIAGGFLHHMAVRTAQEQARVGGDLES